MHSAAGIAAAAAAMHSSTSMANSTSSKDLPSKHSSAQSVSSPEKITENENSSHHKIPIDLKKESSQKKDPAPNNIMSHQIPESSSDIVSSTMEEDEEYCEPINTIRQDEKRGKTKKKVIGLISKEN